MNMHDQPADGSASGSSSRTPSQETMIALDRARQRALGNLPTLVPAAAVTPDVVRPKTERASLPLLDPVKVGDQEILPEWRIDIRVSYVAEGQGIKVPLGQMLDGKWYQYGLGYEPGCPEMDDNQLASFLSEEPILGMSLLTSHEEAVSLVKETREQCLRLAKAKAEHAISLKSGNSGQQKDLPQPNED